MISIVVPAHNESAVIARTLTPWVNKPGADELKIVVVCNGCTDETATIARTFGPAVHVVELEVPSKTNALNAGDEASIGFPRIYIDADILIDIDSIRELARRLERGDILAVAPKPKIDLTHCSRAVRLYYAIRDHLPSSHHGIGGSGVYALSETGRRRFAQFPDVIADDTFVRLQFRPEEREMLPLARSIVFPARTIRKLIAVKTRAYAGSFELARRFPELYTNNGRTNNRALIGLFKEPRLWPALIIYSWVSVIARSRAKFRRPSRTVWHQDETSRRPLPESIS
jgi:glycosyltransferase involved in cell wall biosynthesis